MRLVYLVDLLALVLGLVVLVACWAVQAVPRWPLQRSVVLLVGGSAGIGLETAKTLARRGVRCLILAARREEPLRQAVVDVQAAAAAVGSPTRVHYVQMDVAREESVREGVLAAERLCDGEMIDLLICNAGFALPMRFTECTIADAEVMMEVNYYGSLRMMWALLPSMLAAKRGRVVLTSSMVARAPIAGYSLYASTKAALRALAHSVDMENSSLGVRVQVVSPPDIDTPGYEEEQKIKSPECQAISSFGGSKPFSAADMAEAIVSGIEHYRFDITLGGDGILLSWGSAGIEPATSKRALLTQVAFSGLLRLGLATFSKIHYRIVRRIRLDEAKKGSKKNN
ncbi:unnamed protein product [Phytomonas sp. Hart1]|nr:unnamed protein product [Phytomonas sp. Hart1]|eukprot:CCW68818.1 unnamed protein product [Phytomonas sp. isolate Hart1]